MDATDPAAAHRAAVDDSLAAALAGRPWDARVLELAAGERLDALAAAVGCAPRRYTGAWDGRETDEGVRGRVRTARDAPTDGSSS